MPAQVPEASGIAQSLRRPDLYYVVSDSPKAPVVHAIDETGKVVKTITLSGIGTDQKFGTTGFGDWEDIACGPCEPGALSSCVFVGDIGQNCARTGCRYHRKVQNIIRFEEPTLESGAEVALRGERFWWRYPRGDKVHDAESLMVSPEGEIFVVTKENSPTSFVFRVPLELGHTAVAEKVAEVQAPENAGSGTLLTAADFQIVAGKVAGISLRYYDYVMHYVVRPGEGVVQAFQGTPCKLKSPNMKQSEALTWDRQEGTFYILASEAVGTDIMKVTCGQPPAPKRVFDTFEPFKSSAAAGSVFPAAVALLALVIGFSV